MEAQDEIEQLLGVPWTDLQLLNQPQHVASEHQTAHLTSPQPEQHEACSPSLIARQDAAEENENENDEQHEACSPSLLHANDAEEEQHMC